MKVLFIGGTGIISSACSELAVKRGLELTLLTRGQSFRKIPEGVETINADIRNPESVSKALKGRKFDCVVDWICFSEDHIKTDYQLFRDKTGQLVFISSASAYHTPAPVLPVTESCTLHNPVWEYSRNKIKCEEFLVSKYREDGFPYTIVRPSHTYDKTLLPMEGGFTNIKRMREGKKVIIHGDGSSLWTLTHHRDFAVGLVGLLGHPLAIGEAFHITSSEWLSWNRIFGITAQAAGAELKPVYIPSEVINRYSKSWGDSLFGDKTHSMIFDNSKIKRIVPDFNPVINFHQGAREIIDWYDQDKSRQKYDAEFDALVDKIIEENYKL